MNAQNLADKLAAFGIAAKRVVEPQLHVDGEIVVSTKVHVQVPLSNKKGANVVRQINPGEWLFCDSRRSISELVADIHREMASEICAADRQNQISVKP